MFLYFLILSPLGQLLVIINLLYEALYALYLGLVPACRHYNVRGGERPEGGKQPRRDLIPHFGRVQQLNLGGGGTC